MKVVSRSRKGKSFSTNSGLLQNFFEASLCPRGIFLRQKLKSRSSDYARAEQELECVRAEADIASMVEREQASVCQATQTPFITKEAGV